MKTTTAAKAQTAGPRERPLLLKGNLVKAILDGRKTVTRRPIQPRWATDHPHPRELLAKPPGGEFETVIEPTGYEPGAFRMRTRGSGAGWIIRCPLGAPGDRLWIRETWAAVFDCPELPCECEEGKKTHRRVAYRATDPEGVADYVRGFNDDRPARWRPSLHMRRADCRLVLEIAEVRAERLQEITEEDAKLEGAPRGSIYSDNDGLDAATLPENTHRRGFKHIWQAIYGTQKGLAWANSPWVWRIAFRVAEVRR
jgi:hypothetical protein